MSSKEHSPASLEAHEVSRRVKDTRKEIDNLKAELQKLINAGAGNLITDNQNSTDKHSNADGKPATVPVRAASQLNSPQTACSRPNIVYNSTKPVAQKKVPVNKESSDKKLRTYNVDEAREYIKKQKEKRAEELRSQIKVEDNKLDLKRQKLKELHQKTLELVTKNVQLKRERSKSRERQEPVRLDKADSASNNNLPKPSIRDRSKSADRYFKPPLQVRPKSQDKLKPEGSKQQDRSRSQNRPLRNSSPSQNKKTHVPQSTVPSTREGRSTTRKNLHVVRKTAEPVTRDQVKNSVNKQTHAQVVPQSENIQAGIQVQSKNNTALLKPPEISLDKTVWPSHQKKSTNEHNELTVDAQFLLLSENMQPQSQQLLQPPDVSLDKFVLPPPKNITLRQSNINSQFQSQRRIGMPLLEFLKANNSQNSTKETQTSDISASKEPAWLQPAAAIPYPYNFINTVKQKLQFAVNSPKPAVDVAVQSSLANSKESNDRSKSKEEIRDMLIKSVDSHRNTDWKSFISHKHSSLDLGSVDNLELLPPTPNRACGIAKTDTVVSRKLFTSNGDSESDTSKNIPEISSESAASSKTTLHSETKLSLNKINDLRLVTRSKQSSSDLISTKISTDVEQSVKTSNKRSASHEDSYSSDFVDDPKSKNSIISAAISNNLSIRTTSIPDIDAHFNEQSVVSSSKKSQGLSASNSSLVEEILSFEGKSQITFKSLESEAHPTKTLSENTDISSQNHTEISTAAPTSAKSDALSLREPSVALDTKIGNKSIANGDRMKSITIRPSALNKDNVNEIHLKFEAEVHLLNDFNESLKQFMAVEEAFKHLKQNDSSSAVAKILQNVDTQTSFVTKTVTETPSLANNHTSDASSINFSRGSDILEELDTFVVSKPSFESTFSTGLNLSNTNESRMSSNNESQFHLSLSTVENHDLNHCTGLSLNMFEQLIKEEDARIEHLKVVIKIREQALLDRTKCELLSLDIKRRELLETGKNEEASLIKKKQRGILLKHEQERNEIKRLKQMQKDASKERKNILKQQRSIIKSQLSTKNMMSNIKVTAPRERRQSGPLRVVQSCSESVRSETSISRKSSGEIVSVTSCSHSVVNKVSEESDLDISGVSQLSQLANASKTDHNVANVKRTLFMKEAALQRRRKEVEELLKWNQKLQEEEKKIAELEAAANAVINRTPKKGVATSAEPTLGSHKFSGRQLNQLWRNITGRDDKRYPEDKIYMMSQITLERFCKSARQFASRNRKNRHSDQTSTDLSGGSVIGDTSVSTKSPQKDRSHETKSISEEIATPNSEEYSSAFEPDSVQEVIVDDKNKISSISELIDNFSRIEDEISSLGKKTQRSLNGDGSLVFSEKVVPALNRKISKSVASISSHISVDEGDVSASGTSKQQSEIQSHISEVSNPSKSITEESREAVITTNEMMTPRLRTVGNEIDHETSKNNVIDDIEDDAVKENTVFSEISPIDTDKEISNVEDDNVVIDLTGGDIDKSSTQTIDENLESPSHVSEPDQNKLIRVDSEVIEISSDGEDEDKANNETAADERHTFVINDSSMNEELEIPSNSTENQKPRQIMQQLAHEDHSIVAELSAINENKYSSSSTNVDLKTSADTASIGEEESHNETLLASHDADLSLKVLSNQKTSPSGRTLSISDAENLKIRQNHLSKETAVDEETRTSGDSKTSKQTQDDVIESEQISEVISNNNTSNISDGEDSADKTFTKSSSIPIHLEEIVDIKSAHFDKVDEVQSSPPGDEVSEEAPTEGVSTLKQILSNELLTDKEYTSSEHKEEDTVISSSKALDDDTNEGEREDASTKSSQQQMPSSETNCEDKTPEKIDVKKRVSEILADANLSRGDKSPRFEDIYVTAYDVPATEPADVPEPPSEGKSLPNDIFGTEAEELLRKQLAIEQEIKQLEQQQKEHLPYMFVREIPNKPPPPYTPPSSTSSPTHTIVPTDPKEIDDVTNYTSKVLYKAYQTNNLNNVKFSESSFRLISKFNTGKPCCEFLFNICKELATEHYKQFERVEEPSWLTVTKKPQLARVKPFDGPTLERYMNRKLKELFGFKKMEVVESSVIKWGRKKRDHVDEILVVELQEEESQWTNYDKDELIVKDQLVNDIMTILIDETGAIFKEILAKKKSS